MSEQNAEQQAEANILAMVLAPDEQMGAPGAPDGQDLDAPQDMDAPDEPEQEAEAEAAPEAKAEAAEPEEDVVEIPGEEGQEPVKLKVSELVEAHREFQKIKGTEAQIYERAEAEVAERTREHYQKVTQATLSASHAIQAALQLVQPPQPPDISMRDPRSPKYDPDAYEMARFNYEQGMQRFQMAQSLSAHLAQEAEAATQRANEQRDQQELQKLLRVWPEFGREETQKKFVEDMSKAYGFSFEELDAVLVDHRQAQVARDALAYRQMKAQSGDVKAKVEAKAPKLVRTKQEANAKAPQRARTADGKFQSSALAELKKTNSDDAAARWFAELSRAGRI